MKKLLDCRWFVFGAVLLTAVLDLIALPVADFGAGFVLAGVLLVVFGAIKK